MEKPLIKRWLIGLVLAALLSSCLFGNFMVSADTKDATTGATLALFGDLNDDDGVSASDALEVLQMVVGKHAINDRCVTVADVNGDGNVTAADALQVLQFVVGKIETFPAGVITVIHTWSDWQTKIPSSFTVKGLEQRKCIVCGIVQQREAPLATDLSQQYQLRVLELVNVERVKVGLLPLKPYTQWQWAADQRADDLNVYYSHTRPNGKPWHSLLTNYEGWISMGENIAMGQQTPEKVVTAWMNSPGHRDNMLDPDYTHLLVGVTPCMYEEYYGYCWVQLFVQFD